MGRNRKPARSVETRTNDIFNDDTAAINKKIEDANWSMDVQGLIYDGEYLVRDALEEDDAMAVAMQSLGLDPAKSRDIELMAAIISAFGDESGETFIRQGSNGEDFSIIAVSTASDGMRGFTILPDRIEVRNVSFAKGYAADNIRGLGIAMLARQAWALRTLGERLGKRVFVSTEALSDDDAWNGVELWPRLGYNFDLLDPKAADLLAEARRYGFTSTNTGDLMIERTADGTMGIELWPAIVQGALSANPNESIKINGRMEVTDNDDIGIQLMMAYGRGKKLW